MSDAAERRAHLSDGEIDLYWTGRLPEERLRAFEGHFLECRECLARVEHVEALIDGLADGGAPSSRTNRSGGHVGWIGLAAASVAGLALGWQLHALWRPSEPPTPISPPVVSPASPGQAPERTWVQFTLQPPVRSTDSVQMIRFPAATRFVVLNIDAREVGAPGTVFDMRLTDGRGQLVAAFSALASDASGVVSAAVPSSTLKSGGYVLRLSREPIALEIPFQVETPAAKP